MEELLPLSDHAEISVVDDRDLDVELLLDHRRELARRHLKAPITRDDPDLRLRMRHLRADGRRQREAHGAESARGDQSAWTVVLVVLRLPHLMLAHVAHDDRVSPGSLPEIVDDVGGQQPTVRLVMKDVARLAIPAPPVDSRDPLLVLLRRHHRRQGVERCAEIGDDRHVDSNVLVDLRGVDLHVDLSGLRGVRLEVAGDPIVEAHSEGEQQVGLLNRVVDEGLPVHAHHPETEGMALREAPDTEERQADRRARALDEGL